MSTPVHSSGIIVFHQKAGIVEFLLLKAKYSTEYWDFPKGHLEKGETTLQAAVRETREETGLTGIEILDKFLHEIKYIYTWEGKQFKKKVTFYLGESRTKDVKISSEHIDFRWADYQTAMKIVSFANQKEVLKAANDFLQKNFLVVSSER